MTFIKPTKDGVRKWRWQFAVRQLRKAYDAARLSIDDELRGIDEEVKQFREAPNPDHGDYDAVDSYRAWADHLADRWQEAQSTLAVIKQGFAVILYHSWERHSADWVEWRGNYRHHQVAPRLNNAGYLVTDGVHKLNKVANCIKHDSGELWNQKDCRTMFEPIVAQMAKEDIEPDYARYLILSDADMDGFFEALSESGPPGPATFGL